MINLSPCIEDLIIIFQMRQIERFINGSVYFQKQLVCLFVDCVLVYITLFSSEELHYAIKTVNIFKQSMHIVLSLVFFIHFVLFLDSLYNIVLFLDSLYICTEDVFPTQRLLQLQESIRRTHPLLSRHKFTDHVFVEHISDKV